MQDPQGADPWPDIVIPEVDEGAIAVLLIDRPSGVVTFANPPAILLAGDGAALPATAADWSAAVGLGPVPGAAEWTDPVVHVASGGTVSGGRVVLTGRDGRRRTYWATGAQLMAAGGASHGAMVAFFPLRTDLRPRSGDPTEDAAADAADDAAAAAALDAAMGAGMGAAVDAAVGAAVGGSRDVTRDVVLDLAGGDGSRASLVADHALTARALLASSISFTITDPRQHDNPLIWVNPAFERTTGYSIDDVVGKNCRFLQGPGTDRAEVARIGAALKAGDAVGAELLNYRQDGTAFWNALAISPVLDAEGNVTHFVGVQTDVTARVLAGIEHDQLLAAEREARAAAERARAQLALIEQVGAMLSETLDSEEALQRVVGAVVPELGDFCAVDLVEPVDGDELQVVRRVAVAHRDPALAPLYWRLGEFDRRHPERSYVPGMLRTGRSVLVPPMTQETYLSRAGGDPEAVDLLHRLDADSGAIVPLRARGRVIAVLSIGITRSRGRAFGPEDLALAESLAARAALAVDNARLFEAESAQRRRADALATAGQALAGSLRSTDVVGVLLEQVVPAFADWAFVHVDRTASVALRPSAAGPRAPLSGLHAVASRHADPQREAAYADLLRRWDVGPDVPGPGLAWSTASPQLLPDLLDGLMDTVPGSGPMSAVSVPLTARGLTSGAFTVGRHDGRLFSAEEVEFVTELGRRAALAMENARLYETQRVVALELQRSLLPDQLPKVPELDVAGRYLAGAAGTEVGGDWYDVVQLPDRRVMVAVGDVMGRGVRAAAVMGQMRSALRSYAVEGLSPSEVLERLAAFTSVLEGDHLVTCVVGRFDAASGTVELASAGHPPPLVVTADGVASLVDVDPGLPLGVPAFGTRTDYAVTRIALPAGAGLVLYTDGLVEDRDVPVGEGLIRLSAGMDGMAPGSADDLCDSALNVMGRLDSHDDDTAVLALRVPYPVAATPEGPPPGVRLRFTLVDTGVTGPATARNLVRDALAAPSLSGLVDSASLLVSELVTNALRHGGGPHELAVDADAGGVTVSVSDSSPSPPLPRDGSEAASGILPENGRGLLLVAALADDWGWSSEPSGKRVWFRLRARPNGTGSTGSGAPGAASGTHGAGNGGRGAGTGGNGTPGGGGRPARAARHAVES